MISWKSHPGLDTQQSSVSYSAGWSVPRPRVVGEARSQFHSSVRILAQKVSVSKSSFIQRGLTQRTVWHQCWCDGTWRCADTWSRYLYRIRPCPACISLGRLQNRCGRQVDGREVPCLEQGLRLRLRVFKLTYLQLNLSSLGSVCSSCQGMLCIWGLYQLSSWMSSPCLPCQPGLSRPKSLWLWRHFSEQTFARTY